MTYQTYHQEGFPPFLTVNHRVATFGSTRSVLFGNFSLIRCGNNLKGITYHQRVYGRRRGHLQEGSVTLEIGGAQSFERFLISNHIPLYYMYLHTKNANFDVKRQSQV